MSKKIIIMKSKPLLKTTQCMRRGLIYPSPHLIYVTDINTTNTKYYNYLINNIKMSNEACKNSKMLSNKYTENRIGYYL